MIMVFECSRSYYMKSYVRIDKLGGEPFLASVSMAGIIGGS